MRFARQGNGRDRSRLQATIYSHRQGQGCFVLKNAEEVFPATDPDREGEVIAWHLQEALKLKNATRVTDTEITEAAIRAALFNIRELEKRGIGRPSTYAAIIDTISSRKYVITEKRFLVPTALGEKIVFGLYGHFVFIKYDFARNMEQSLNDIAEGKAEYRVVISSVYDQFSREVQEFVKATGKVCEKYGKSRGHLVKKIGYDRYRLCRNPTAKGTP